jgi:hypothetical protein
MPSCFFSKAGLKKISIEMGDIDCEGLEDMPGAERFYHANCGFIISVK